MSLHDCVGKLCQLSASTHTQQTSHLLTVKLFQPVSSYILSFNTKWSWNWIYSILKKRSKQPISKVSLTISEIIHSEAVRRMCQLTSFIHYFKFTLIRTERVRTNPIMHQKARQGNTHRANTLHANIFTVSSPPPPSVTGN